MTRSVNGAADDEFPRSQQADKFAASLSPRPHCWWERVWVRVPLSFPSACGWPSSPVLARARDSARRRRRVLDYVDPARGQPRVPGLVVFALDFEQAAVAQVGQLTAQRVERDRQLDVGQ